MKSMKQLLIELLLIYFTIHRNQPKESSTVLSLRILTRVNVETIVTVQHGFICDSNKCLCGNANSDAVVCDNQKQISAVLDCHCVTYDKECQSTFAGLCFYNCENHHSKKKNDLVTTKLPKRAEMLLNFSVCRYFNRAGLLCGDCEEGYSPLVLSYNLSCVKCPDGHKNWWKFILAGLVPLTFFYIFVVIFNINVTSSRLHGVVWYSQALSIPVLVRMIFSALAQGYPRLMKAIKVLMTLYSYWNLEPLRFYTS